jgi:transcriptional regulator with GAF, ATPase, and Fis domain
MMDGIDHTGQRGARTEPPREAEMATFDPAGAGAAEAFARLAIELHGAGGLEETVDAVVQFALQALDCSHSGVALYSRGRPQVPAATDPLVCEIFYHAMATGQAPLVEAMRTGQDVLVRDTVTDGRWPEWAAEVRELGVRAVLDVPLTTATGTVGMLGLYSTTPDAFDPDDIAVAQILARHASVALASARHEANLAQAVDARKLVGQAMGILMERFDLDSDRAFTVLRRYSQDTNTKLRDVAQQLIDTRRLPGTKARPLNAEAAPGNQDGQRGSANRPVGA